MHPAIRAGTCSVYGADCGGRNVGRSRSSCKPFALLRHAPDIVGEYERLAEYRGPIARRLAARSSMVGMWFFVCSSFVEGRSAL